MTDTTPQRSGFAARLGAVPGRYWLALALAVLALIFVVQNREDAHVNFLFIDVTSPLWLALIISLAVGLVIGLLLRRRRSSST